MKNDFVGQRRFVGHQKKNHFGIIVVCMKYKYQRRLVHAGSWTVMDSLVRGLAWMTLEKEDVDFWITLNKC